MIYNSHHKSSLRFRSIDWIYLARLSVPVKKNGFIILLKDLKVPWTQTKAEQGEQQRFLFWRRFSFSHWVTVLLYLIICSMKEISQFIVIVWLINIWRFNLVLLRRRSKCLGQKHSTCNICYIMFNKPCKSYYGQVFWTISRSIFC